MNYVPGPARELFLISVYSNRAGQVRDLLELGANVNHVD